MGIVYFAIVAPYITKMCINNKVNSPHTIHIYACASWPSECWSFASPAADAFSFHKLPQLQLQCPYGWELCVLMV